MREPKVSVDLIERPTRDRSLSSRMRNGTTQKPDLLVSLCRCRFTTDKYFGGIRNLIKDRSRDDWPSSRLSQTAIFRSRTPHVNARDWMSDVGLNTGL